MDIFRISPDPDRSFQREDLENGQADTSFKGVTTSCDTGSFSPDDEGNTEQGHLDKLVEMMSDFSISFDPGSFATRVISSRPILKDSLAPGSFSHFLLILLEPWVDLQKIQESMMAWLVHRFPDMDMGFPAPIRPAETNATDQTFFVAEIEMLRILLAPLREDSPSAPIFWINTRRDAANEMCDQLEFSFIAIDEFKNDVDAVLTGMNGHGRRTSVYPSLPVGWKRMSLLSKRQLRMDACKATLFWENFSKSELDFTSFFHYYKDHMCKHSPDKAVDLGWLPPHELRLPNLPSSAAENPDPISGNPSKGSTNIALNLMFDTARWLALARGLPAVHLFCDVARLFSGCNLPGNAGHSRLELLHYLSQIRVSSDCIPTRPSSALQSQDRYFANRNPDYFIDSWKSSKSLTDDIFQNVSLFERRWNTNRANILDIRLRPDIRGCTMPGMNAQNTKLPVESNCNAFGQFYDRRATLPEWYKSAGDMTPLPKMSSPVDIAPRKTLEWNVDEPDLANHPSFSVCSTLGREKRTRTPTFGQDDFSSGAGEND